MHFEDEIYCFLYKVEVHHFKLASNPSQITLLQMQKNRGRLMFKRLRYLRTLVTLILILSGITLSYHSSI